MFCLVMVCQQVYSSVWAALLTYAYLIHFFMLSAAEKIAVYQNDGAGYELFQTIILLATFLSGVAYVFWS